jgi:hypothetical protein
MTKQRSLKATGAQPSIVEHITDEELKRKIGDTAETFKGFANRFVWRFSVWSKTILHTMPLPEGCLNTDILSAREAPVFGRKLGLMRRDAAAEVL